MAWRFALTICVHSGLTSSGVLLANGHAFVVVGYPLEGLVHTLGDVDPRGLAGLRRFAKEIYE